MKTGIVIGATGLVGRELVTQLLENDNFSKVVVFARRNTGIHHDKLQEHLIDFEKADTWEHLVKGDVLFSALGTTLKQAGGKEEQYKIDYTFQYNFAQAAAGNGVPAYVLVSAANSDPSSRIFYSRMKGELERDVKQLSFNCIHIIQPGLLAGERNEERAGEKIGFVLLNGLNKVGLLKKYRPVHGSIVAKAMVNASLSAATGIHTYTLDKVFTVAEEAKISA